MWEILLKLVIDAGWKAQSQDAVFGKRKTPWKKSKGHCVQPKEAPCRHADFPREKTPEQHPFSSLIRTVTVGFGISPNQP